MIKSIFKVLWKRKKFNLLMIVEMFLSTLLLFALSTIIVYNVNLYVQPLGFDYKNVWKVRIKFHEQLEIETESRPDDILKLFVENIKSMSEVESVSNSTPFVPYYPGSFKTGLKYKEQWCNNARLNETDEHFAVVLNMQINRGRWFRPDDLGLKATPVVINKALEDILFAGESALGKIIHSGEYKVVGILDYIRLRGEFEPEEPHFFKPIQPTDCKNTFLIKTKPGTGLAFEKMLMRYASSAFKGWTVTVEKIQKIREKTIRRYWIPIIIFGAICLFLVINILLGMYGILLNSIINRKAEIGLRRSLGASTKQIYMQFTGEMLALTTIGILPALLIAVQFPLLNAFGIEQIVFLIAMACSITFIYIMVLLTSILPGRYAAKVQPAVALHEE